MNVTSPFRRMAKVFTLVSLSLVLLTSCSSTKLAYNLLDVVIQWQLGKYVSMDKQQKAMTKAGIADFLQWHRNTQLVRYADYIDGFLTRLDQQPMTGKRIHKETDEVQLLLDTSMEKFLPIITDLVHSFSQEQCDEALEKIAEKKQEYREEYVEVSEKELFKQRRTDLTDELGPFFGRFTDEQKLAIDEWAKALTPYESLAEKQYDAWADMFAAAFAERDDKAALQEKLRAIVLYRTDEWDPELEKILDENQALTYNLIADLVNTQNDKQREKFVKKLKGFQEDFHELAEG